MSGTSFGITYGRKTRGRTGLCIVVSRSLFGRVHNYLFRLTSSPPQDPHAMARASSPKSARNPPGNQLDRAIHASCIGVASTEHGPARPQLRAYSAPPQDLLRARASPRRAKTDHLWRTLGDRCRFAFARPASRNGREAQQRGMHHGVESDRSRIVDSQRPAEHRTPSSPCVRRFHLRFTEL
jgi:hypothetical protein